MDEDEPDRPQWTALAIVAAVVMGAMVIVAIVAIVYAWS